MQSTEMIRVCLILVIKMFARELLRDIQLNIKDTIFGFGAEMMRNLGHAYYMVFSGISNHFIGISTITHNNVIMPRNPIDFIKKIYELNKNGVFVELSDGFIGSNRVIHKLEHIFIIHDNYGFKTTGESWHLPVAGVAMRCSHNSYERWL
jgi:hypothetical protein